MKFVWFSILSLTSCLFLSHCCGFNTTELLQLATKQYSKVASTVGSNQFPSSGRLTDSRWHVTGFNGWTAGFYPGVLWSLYKYTGQDKWKQLAIRWTDSLYNARLITGHHDIGFIIMSSYGLAFELTGNETYQQVIIEAANSLATRFNPRVGCTRSWNSNRNEFLVIVDNMMNLELLLKAWEFTKNSTYYDIAVSHANRTLKEHLRPDASSYHVVAFNETTGQVMRRFTHQGYADWSCWSRGQAWLLAGFTLAYKYTRLGHLLQVAERVTDYYINNLPDDFVAFADFNVPTDNYHRYVPRDTSSAAIAAYGLLELYNQTLKQKYQQAATKIMTSLANKYRADANSKYKLPALLANASASYQGGHDIALSFGDYYFVRALGYYL